MEIFDLVDENDKVIGKASREECHSDPKLIHRTVHFSLVDRKNKKVFLTQRSFEQKTDAGKLCFLGEHMLTSEDWDQGLVRGVKEELGLEAAAFKEVAHHLFHFPNQTEFVRFYIVDWNGETIDVEKEEIIDSKWMSVDTLLKEKDSYSDMTRFWVENVNWLDEL